MKGGGARSLAPGAICDVCIRDGMARAFGTDRLEPGRAIHSRPGLGFIND
jgi:hypothetical protein